MKWLGPLLAGCAVLASVGWLAWTLSHRHAETPELLRLGTVVPGSLDPVKDFIAPRLGARAAATLASADLEGRGKAVIERMLGATGVPSVVKYTVTHGGTLRDIANMFGIFHHEMVAMNPEYGLDSVVAPEMRVVVYRRDFAGPSVSIGRASAGKLEGAVPMVEGPGRLLRPHRFKLWGTAATVARLDFVLRQWAIRYPDQQPILVGNLSLRTGGKNKPHHTHQSGRDVDVSFIQVWDGVEPPIWQEMNASNLDREGTWKLLRVFAETEAIAVIYVDYALQKLLYDYAVENAILTPEELDGWLEYPAAIGKKDKAIVKHAPGHSDHIHARFRCPTDDDRCIED